MQRKPPVNMHLRFLLTIALFFLSSCAASRKSVYFRDLETTNVSSVALPEFNAPVIQPDNILTIIVQTVDPGASAAVNQLAAIPAVGASSAATIGNQEIRGFLVDKDGNITIPMLGTLKVAGLTTYQARELITAEASRYFINPIVHVRFANFKVTVIGEVNSPATYTLPNEKVTLLDAIGLAGDLTIHGKRENVLLIRENHGEKEFVRFNLNSSDIFSSPYFYLKQNDVIYVEPGKGKAAATNAARSQMISILGAVISVAIVALSRL